MIPQSRVRERADRILAISNDPSLSFEEAYSQRIAFGNQLISAELSPRRLRSFSKETNRRLLDSFGDLSFYTYGTEPYVSMQRRVFDELAARGAVTQYDKEDLFKSYLASREFDKAGAIRVRFPKAGLPDIPEIIVSTGATGGLHRVYDISVDSRTAALIRLSIESGPRIIVSAFNGCPVATRAFQSLAADPGLERLLESFGIILTIRFEPAGIAARNAKNSGPRMYIAHTKDDWPGIEFYRSPTFYFLKDGKVLQKIAGWDSNTSIQDFRRRLDSIGLGRL